MSSRAEIYNILVTVSGIGKVYNRYVSVTSEKEVKDRLVVNGKVNAIFFVLINESITNDETFDLKEKRETFRFALYYGYNFESRTEDVVLNIKDDILSKFNTNETLNNSVSYHENISMIDNIFVTFGNILCHLLIFELTTVSSLELT